MRDPSLAGNRRTAETAGHSAEPFHALTYFAQECRDAAEQVGLRGFWNGYFALARSSARRQWAPRS